VQTQGTVRLGKPTSRCLLFQKFTNPPRNTDQSLTIIESLCIKFSRLIQLRLIPLTQRSCCARQTQPHFSNSVWRPDSTCHILGWGHCPSDLSRLVLNFLTSAPWYA
jgi:hypothetical protein